MSHFTVLVVGEDVEGQLAPYHEFECTGENDQFIQEVDVTEESIADYNKYTATKWKDPEGRLHDPYSADNRFYRDMTPEEIEDRKQHPMGIGGKFRLNLMTRDPVDGKGERIMVRELPSGWEEVEVPYKDVETFVEFIGHWSGKSPVQFGETPDLEGDHKYGYALLDEQGEVTKVVRRTNPEAKWDWYQIGGRWTGYFKLRPLGLVPIGKKTLESLGFTDNELSELRKIKNKNGRKFERLVAKFIGKEAEVLAAVRGVFEEYPEHSVGRPGIFTERAKVGYADSCKKKYIDFETMRRQAEEAAGKAYDAVQAILKDLPKAVPWEEIREKYCPSDNFDRIDEARKAYGSQPRVEALRKASMSEDNPGIGWDSSPEDFDIAREVYLRRARDGAIQTFAVVKDGRWFERGEMGWWAMVSNEKDDETWNSMFSKLLDDVPDDTLLTVVDCHI